MLRRMDVSAVTLARQVRAGELSAAESVRAALARAREAQARTNAFVTLAEAEALAAAERVDARLAAGEALPLAGVPLVVKDNLCTRGVRTTAGSRMLEGFVPPYDATVVARLVAAGAVTIGKASLDEFGMGSGNENSPFGAVANPLDPTRVAGGSSGGSAAAVAAGAAPLALGSDTGGSVRLPAAFCGLVGFKPSYGALSRYGVIAYASSLDQVGILARDLADVELAFELATGADPFDATTYDLPAAGPPVAIEGLRVGLPRELLSDGFGAAALAAVERAAASLEEQGAELVELSLPSAPAAPACYFVAATGEASSDLARFDGTLFGGRVGAEAAGQEAVMRASRGALFGPEVKRRLLFGTLALSAERYDELYGRALRVRRKLAGELEAALERADVLLLPTAAGVAFELGREEPFEARFQGPAFHTDMATALANLAGLPAVSLPGGTGEGGLPLGVQLMGRARGDRALLGVARHLV